MQQGDDRGCIAPVNGLHQVSACDNEADGHGVYVEVDWTDAAQNETVGDGNGSAAGCGTVRYLDAPYRYRVCESVTGPDYCSSWVNYYG